MKALKSTYPLGHILNPATRYVPSQHTDIRKTFARVMRESQPTVFDRPTPTVFPPPADKANT